MTTIAAIRTHRWGADEERLSAQLAPVFGGRLVVVFHNRPPDVEVPFPVVDLTDEWVQSNGLRVVKEYGWRCGDYAQYVLRQAFPAADEYWLIEPDVYFHGPVAEFFHCAAAERADVLCVELSRANPLHRFCRTLPPPMEAWRAIFALTRMSGRAIDALFALRRAYSARVLAQRVYANDEIFCFSHLKAQDVLTVAELTKQMPDWFDQGDVRTDPDMLFEVVAQQQGKGVFHPVRGRASFRGAVAERITDAMHFVAEMHPSLALLDDVDLQLIADDVRRRVLDVLCLQRDAGRASAQREDARVDASVRGADGLAETGTGAQRG